MFFDEFDWKNIKGIVNNLDNQVTTQNQMNQTKLKEITQQLNKSFTNKHPKTKT